MKIIQFEELREFKVSIIKNKIFVTTVSLVLLFGLMACGVAVGSDESVSNDRYKLISKQVISGSEYLTIKDTLTGCQYVSQYKGSIELLVDKDGHPLCD